MNELLDLAAATGKSAAELRAVADSVRSPLKIGAMRIGSAKVFPRTRADKELWRNQFCGSWSETLANEGPHEVRTSCTDRRIESKYGFAAQAAAALAPIINRPIRFAANDPLFYLQNGKIVEYASPGCWLNRN